MDVLLRQLALWTVICSVSAAPSFVIAASHYNRPSQLLAMLSAIACFIIGYAALSSTSVARRLRKRAFVLTTLKIGYGTRICLSLIAVGAPALPLLIFPDLFFGFLSMGITDEVLDMEEGSAAMIFTTTLIEGGLWNIALAVYMLIIHAIQVLFRRKPFAQNLCQQCGYDLRASAGKCPECGKPISETLAVPATTIS